MFLHDQDIVKFLSARDLDVRKWGKKRRRGEKCVARWIDQKCTPDVLCAVADCIVLYVTDPKRQEQQDLFGTPVVEFKSADIWFSPDSESTIIKIFKKPDLKKEAAKNEYDKFFMQPMELLSYAGVLSKRKEGHSNVYKVENLPVLQYLQLSERSALNFLHRYITKVLTDSGLMSVFDDFFDKQTPKAYEDVKMAFADFTYKNTPIQGLLEPYRIFSKVLNPLAFKRDTKGTERGRLSADKITYDMLMYNRQNFRDIFSAKPKGLTRKEAQILQDNDKPNENYYRFQSDKAKRLLQRFVQENYGQKTEHREGHHVHDKATQIHHIFPEAQYPEIAGLLENLIALTPTQHYNHAHPDGATQKINYEYQYLLLLSKMKRIREYLDQNQDLQEDDLFYTFARFITVLSVGFDNPDLKDEISSWEDAMRAINVHYSKQPDANPPVE